jgi:hypothetical protein
MAIYVVMAKRFSLVALLAVLLLLSACGIEPPVFVTATPEGTLQPTDAISTTVAPTIEASLTSVPNPSPTRQFPTNTPEASEHQQCAIAHINCYVNENPTLLNGVIRHTLWGGRNLDIPQGYRAKISASPSPFVYCKTEYRGCQFEFHWIAGSWGFQAEGVTLYPDTAYMIKMVYTVHANCAPGNTCDLSNLSVGSNVYLNDRPTILTPQSVANRTGVQQESVWAIQVVGTENESVVADIQTYLNVQWSVFAEPAKFTIHEIGVIAQPSDFDGYVYPIVRNS